MYTIYPKNQFPVLLTIIMVFTFPFGLDTPYTSSGFPSVVNAQLMQADGSTANGDLGERMHQQLMEKPKRQGTVLVIVTLQVHHFSPEGNQGSEQAVAARQAAIAEVQKRVLERMEPFSVSNVKQFSFTPNLAMEVDAAGLKDLLANPDVLDIQEDMAVPPAF